MKSFHLVAPLAQCCPVNHQKNYTEFTNLYLAFLSPSLGGPTDCALCVSFYAQKCYINKVRLIDHKGLNSTTVLTLFEKWIKEWISTILVRIETK